MDDWRAIADGDGIFHATTARAVGLSTRDLARLVAKGDVIRLARGWYCLALPPLDPDLDHPAERRRQLHAAQTRAQVLAHEGRSVASHHSALVLHGLPVFGADLRRIHLTRTKDTWSRRRGLLNIHQMVGGATYDGGVMEPAVAIVQSGVENGPLAALVRRRRCPATRPRLPVGSRPRRNPCP